MANKAKSNPAPAPEAPAEESPVAPVAQVETPVEAPKAPKAKQKEPEVSAGVTPVVAEGFDLEAYKKDVESRGKVFGVLSDGSLIEK